MMKIGVPEIVLIIVLALVLFGGGKLAGLGKALGKSIKEFRSEVKPDDPVVDTTVVNAAEKKEA